MTGLFEIEGIVRGKGCSRLRVFNIEGCLRLRVVRDRELLR